MPGYNRYAKEGTQFIFSGERFSRLRKLATSGFEGLVRGTKGGRKKSEDEEKEWTKDDW